LKDKTNFYCVIMAQNFYLVFKINLKIKNREFERNPLVYIISKPHSLAELFHFWSSTHTNEPSQNFCFLTCNSPWAIEAEIYFLWQALFIFKIQNKSAHYQSGMCSCYNNTALSYILCNTFYINKKKRYKDTG
jgi:hypothetical protein